MGKAVAINGSPRMGKGYTAMILAPFIEGITEAGYEVKQFFASRMHIKPCVCDDMYCWYKKPGECCIKDDMELLYPELHHAEILILATPVYVPLPGDMQNIINRLCPLMQPLLEFHQGRTRARLHKNVAIRKLALVATGAWWEKENLGTVSRIAEELARDMNVEFAGALLRPHAFIMKKEDEYTAAGKEILMAAKKAGYDLIKNGSMGKETLESISRPLIPEEQLRKMYNQLLSSIPPSL
jgi:multimeric flavodoxin WrbA